MKKEELKNNDNIMTAETLTTAYFAYYRNRKEGPNTSSESSYGTYLYALRFWVIDKILKYWKVAKNNNKYYETFDIKNVAKEENEIITFNKFNEWKIGTYVECSERNYHLCDYYRQYIYIKNPKNDTNKTGVKNDKPGYNYLKYVAAFLGVDDMVHALTIIDIVMGIIQKALDHNKQLKETKNAIDEKDRKNLVESRGALALMREWIEFGKDEKGKPLFVQNVKSAEEKSLISQEELDIFRSNIDAKLIHKIDGAIALVREIGIDNFIQYAIEQSFFFEPDLVVKRMEDIANTFFKRHDDGDFKGQYFDLYARSSTKIATDDMFQEQEDEGNDNQHNDNSYSQKLEENDDQQKMRKNKEICERKINGDRALRKNSKLDKYAWFTDKKSKVNNYPIIIDNDGNAKVRSIITEKTGYTVSAGKSDIFQNYKISHIWGRAYDPRFFTNLWNIVLVPSWANDLLDKNALEGTLESKLKSTIMRICEVLYFNEIKLIQCIKHKDVWSVLKMHQPSVINKGNDKVMPKYIISGIEVRELITKGKQSSQDDLPYVINIISEKRGEAIGDIVKYAVYI